MALLFPYNVFILCIHLITLTTAPHIFRMRQCLPPSVCVDIMRCPSLNYSLKSIVTLNVQKYFCGFRSYMPKVCCLMSSENNTAISKWSSELSDHKNFDLLPVDRCGVISSRFRITSGSATSPGEFPWMALIAFKTDGLSNKEDFRCGGTLINKLYILTAAHCVYNATLLGVRLGEHDTMTEIDCDYTGQNCESPVQDLLIKNIITHPLYDPFSYINDIALIKLAKPANYSYGNVSPICLPFGDLLHVELEGQELTVAGWGATEDGDKSTVLRKVSVPVMSLKNCRKLYEDLKPITKRQICAGADRGRDSCAGDSGGPLKKVDTVNESPRYVQYGIVSYGPTKCGINLRPGIYTSVKEYMGWILDNMERD